MDDKQQYVEFEEDSQQTALVHANGNEALGFLDNTLSNISDNQKSLLNSQAANRELMGVVIQDNFNLKDENTRLRERVLELEKRVAQIGREEQHQREAMRQEFESKITAIHQMATDAMVTAKTTEAPDIKAVSTERGGCLGSLFGGGGMKIITLPRRRNNETAAETGHASTPAAAQAQAGGEHPKPMFPPE
ncbi:hypothetical protein QUF63_06680 [Anaerolineales bacterium HSG25]|nr:hypothetical protein [Anaerolineales bacterium HSG25]